MCVISQVPFRSMAEGSDLGQAAELVQKICMGRNDRRKTRKKPSLWDSLPGERMLPKSPLTGEFAVWYVMVGRAGFEPA